MKQRDFNKKLILNKKTITTLNGDLMRTVRGGNKDPHDPTWDCTGGGDTGGGGDTAITCPSNWWTCICTVPMLTCDC